jgi:FixJ family two-component response regulator
MTGGSDNDTSSQRELQFAKKDGANAILRKPYSAEEMLSSVQVALEDIHDGVAAL